MWQGTNSMTCMYFTEFAENGSIYDYIHKDHKKPPLSQILLWAVQVAEGIVFMAVKLAKCCPPGVVAMVLLQVYRVPLAWYLLDGYVRYTPGRGKIVPRNVINLNNERLTTSEWPTKILTTPS